MKVGHMRREPDQSSSRHPSNSKINSETLTNIIKSAKMVIVAPLIASAYQIPTLIATGHYLAAIKSSLTASATFLLLAGSLFLADMVGDIIRGRAGSFAARRQ